ncbi:Class I SAM-dependent methyltransferase [Sulfidibacter corallicola]|uniref:Class I SAM-dependent methyltransferase n=1 Tax=Sulfidibacter corallicola TaxID=2818388 RepID=A0A8A4TTI4_SULCO|nr:hypothetical protein [Sulfidibacter corallicola]QTD52381.1 class I SAM-dependent methyltransferase [Sulfidibacter corallicola]
MNFKTLKAMFVLCAAFMMVAAFAGDPHQASKGKLKKIANGDHRSDENKARNEFRHPVETLSFFGVKEDMTVVEIWPGGGGWYLEILAPYLKDKGTYIAASFSKEPQHKYAEYFRKANEKLAAKLDGDKKNYGKVKVTEFFPANDVASLGPKGEVDMILTFRNLHNWAPDYNKAMRAFYDHLKPGGVLGLVEHRTTDKQDPEAASGYMNQAYVIEMAKKAGFELVDKSEINANPKDTAKHEKGVWTLPPTYALGEKDKAKYSSIGESDRMTLKFVKPKK